MAPVIAQEWRCDNDAPVDVEGCPLTQYYTQDDECMLKGPAPVFFPINQETPTDAVPANLILPRWPTGPDQRIVESNPLYQYARSNVPIEDEKLWVKPMIHAFNLRFFNMYDLLSQICWQPHSGTRHIIKQITLSRGQSTIWSRQ
eukprot:scaffold15278_cov37-Attheya_sp.AAC.3